MSLLKCFCVQQIIKYTSMHNQIRKVPSMSVAIWVPNPVRPFLNLKHMCKSSLATATGLNWSKFPSFLRPFGPILAKFSIWVSSFVRWHPMNVMWRLGVNTIIFLVWNWQKNHKNGQNPVLKVKNSIIFPISKKAVADFTYIDPCDVKNLMAQKKNSSDWGNVSVLGVDCAIKKKQLH